MRPSDLRARQAPVTETKEKRYPMSLRADPPIAAEEVKGATVAVCCWHGGLIKTFGDKDGKVFICPIGNQLWRYNKPGLHTIFRAPLTYPRRSGIA